MLAKPSAKIIVSERSDEGGVLVHQGYPAWKELEKWESFIKKDRHGPVSNYLFADWHVSPLRFENTVGEEIVDEESEEGDGHRNDTNMHYVAGFIEPDDSEEEPEEPEEPET